LAIDFEHPLKIAQPVSVKGDVNGDGEVRSNDAILTLRISAGLIIPTDYQKQAADMNDDGKVASNDAILILRKAAGMAAPSKGVVAGISKQITATLDESHGVAGESITVPVKVDSISGLAGGDICIAYDQTILRVVDVSSNPSILLASNTTEPGMVSIAFASSGDLNSKTLAKIQFNVLVDDISPLKFKSMDLYSSDALPIDSVKINGRFSSLATPPEFSALLQNFPNPFNPDTWIPYQLKEGSEVIIRIYNVPGELIREIRLGHKAAGLYVSQDRAAYWDGRNETGENVASGIYFCSIQAGEFTAMCKMIVAR
jgi:hypothetical protein